MAISKEAEQKIYNGLVRVAALTKAGSSPNAAIVKIASEDKIPAGHVRLMINAYNTGRTNRQRTSAESLFDKLAAFELADPAVIIGELYPSHVKSAAEVEREVVVSDEYELSPRWMTEKASADRLANTPEPFADDKPLPPPPRDPNRFCKQADGYLQRLNNERERLYGEVQNAWEKVSSAFDGLQNYFKRLNHLPFDDVRANAEALYGKPAVHLFDKLADMAGCSAKPAVAPMPKKKGVPAAPVAVKKSHVVGHAVDRSLPPYSYVATVIEGALEHKEWFDKTAAFEKEATVLELRLDHVLRAEKPVPLAPDYGLSLLRRLGGEKRAFFGSAAGTLMQGAELGLGAETGRSIMSKLSPKTDDKLKSDAYSDLMDPSHESKLRSIRTQSALHGILNGPYFEGEDPVKVTELFNNLTRLSPRMADQPILLESAMRRLAAQGSADPHDLDQLLGIETKMKTRDRAPKDETTSSGE